uniref:Uncharacterized protein n=1 Tax=Rhizophora mucronata TaxID=61149 RepID=A0A2P2Q454_RHIMU
MSRKDELLHTYMCLQSVFFVFKDPKLISVELWYLSQHCISLSCWRLPDFDKLFIYLFIWFEHSTFFFIFL